MVSQHGFWRISAIDLSGCGLVYSKKKDCKLNIEFTEAPALVAISVDRSLI